MPKKNIKGIQKKYKISGVVPPKMIFTFTSDDCINVEAINAGDDELCEVLYAVLRMFCENATDNKISKKEIADTLHEIVNLFLKNEVIDNDKL